MKEVLTQMQEWMQKQKDFAIARVTKTWGSSPRPVGSTMLISTDMEMVGSVSGGCVEGAVLKASKQIIENGGGKILEFGISNDEAWSVGLSCGGKLEVYLQAFESNNENKTCWDTLLNKLFNNESCILITLLQDGVNENTLLVNEKTVGAPIPEKVKATALQALSKGKNQVIQVEGNTYFIQALPRKNQLLIIGAAHIATVLVQLAYMYDFEPIVIDPRGAFAKNTYFEEKPEKILEAYPSEVFNQFSLDAQTYAVILSHDPKIDDDALQLLLRSNVAYIGALGSRKTHEKRTNRLLEAGFSQEQISRIEAPIGLDIGAQGAKEIALSIMASIIKTKNGL